MTLSGDKQAWPVYLMIGNIDKKIRQCPSARATMLIGYLPVMKLECFTEKRRPTVTYQLFHRCMELLLETLKILCKEVMVLTCDVGWLRKVLYSLPPSITSFPP